MQGKEKNIPIKKRAMMKEQTTEDSSSPLISRAKMVFLNSIDKEASSLISQLNLRHESEQFQSAKSLYKFCFAYFQNSLVRLLLELYRSSSMRKPKIASKSISLLLALLTCIEQRRINLSRFATPIIKPLLISCLVMQETQDSDIEILSRIMCVVASEVLMSDNNGWDELSVCIVSVADSDLRKAFVFVRDLPPVYENFMIVILQRLFPEILNALLNIERSNAKDWSLALQTGIKMAIQLMDTVRSDLVGSIMYAIYNSASKLLKQEKEEVLHLGLQELEMNLREYTFLHDSEQYALLLEFTSKMGKMNGTGKQTKDAVEKIFRFLDLVSTL